MSYADLVNTAPSSIEPDVAFARGLQPGFTMYPTSGTLDAVRQKLSEHGNPHWASAEGTNLVPGADVASVTDTMETYLAQRFNHGATLVNIFSWGIGGAAMKGINPFRIVTERDEAIQAYRKFLASGN